MEHLVTPPSPERSLCSAVSRVTGPCHQGLGRECWSTWPCGSAWAALSARPPRPRCSTWDPGACEVGARGQLPGGRLPAGDVEPVTHPVAGFGLPPCKRTMVTATGTLRGQSPLRGLRVSRGGTDTSAPATQDQTVGVPRGAGARVASSAWGQGHFRRKGHTQVLGQQLPGRPQWGWASAVLGPQEVGRGP